ncbi:MAG: SCO family protein [Gammaproteobacteria bacterium]|nr:SCO family protein [Gammaproteobacteria bacterium]
MKRTVIFSLAAMLGATALFALVFQLTRPTEPEKPMPAELYSVVLDTPRSLAPFRLEDSEGSVFDQSRLQGKWSLLFFGYTHCPDICPTTLATLRRVARTLQQTPEYYADTQFIFVSVDPRRDTVNHLKDYIGYFHPDFLAATGEKEQIDRLASQLGAIYMFDGDTASDDYIVNHSASIAVVDPQGRWAARFNPPHTASEMANDFRRLRDYLQP